MRGSWHTTTRFSSFTVTFGKYCNLNQMYALQGHIKFNNACFIIFIIIYYTDINNYLFSIKTIIVFIGINCQFFQAPEFICGEVLFLFIENGFSYVIYYDYHFSHRNPSWLLFTTHPFWIYPFSFSC